VLLLPVVPYLVTLVAGADATVARALLFTGPDDNLRAELTEVSASHARLAGAFEAERRRIERDLHDGAQQKLVSLTMQLASPGSTCRRTRQPPRPWPPRTTRPGS
jgi:signal transduction histidine kinase